MFCKKNKSNVYFTPGDYKRFTEIFNYFYVRLCFFANKILKDRQTSEDLVSDVFVKLWTNPLTFETEANAKAWLYITTRNTCFNYSKKTRQCKYEIEVNSVYTDETVLTSIIQTEILQEIMNIIERLPTECRRIFKLSYFDDLSNQEIAEKLCLSIHTVKNQKARGIYLLKKRMRIL
jgi:RNA polymerase sigma-70 factor (family 1)